MRGNPAKSRVRAGQSEALRCNARQPARSEKPPAAEKGQLLATLRWMWAAHEGQPVEPQAVSQTPPVRCRRGTHPSRCDVLFTVARRPLACNGIDPVPATYGGPCAGAAATKRRRVAQGLRAASNLGAGQGGMDSVLPPRGSRGSRRLDLRSGCWHRGVRGDKSASGSDDCRWFGFARRDHDCPARRRHGLREGLLRQRGRLKGARAALPSDRGTTFLEDARGAATALSAVQKNGGWHALTASRSATGAPHASARLL